MAKKQRPNQTIKAIVPSSRRSIERLSVDQLAGIPEEEIWLASRKSARTRRAYRNDVQHFLHTQEHSLALVPFDVSPSRVILLDDATV
jgi:hypothetical protein